MPTPATATSRIVSNPKAIGESLLPAEFDRKRAQFELNSDLGQLIDRRVQVPHHEHTLWEGGQRHRARPAQIATQAVHRDRMKRRSRPDADRVRSEPGAAGTPLPPGEGDRPTPPALLGEKSHAAVLDLQEAFDEMR